MQSSTERVLTCGVLAAAIVAAGPSSLAREVHHGAQGGRAGAPQPIDLAKALADGRLRAVNRDVTAAKDRNGVRVSERQGNGLVWIEGTDFAQGTIELEVRGRDEFQRSFVGVAFHGKDDDTYEVVYLRPFNFRAEDPVRRQHAVQYMAAPDYEWPRLRKEFPEEFENPVDQSIVPTDWVPLRIVVADRRVQIHVGRVTSPTLEVRKLGAHDRGRVGLWTGNNSDGAFANLRITPAR